MKNGRIAIITAAMLGTVFSATALAAADAEAAKKYMKKNDCFKCHAEDKTKKGPSYKKIADKYKDKADADAKMYEHMTSSKKVKLEDGSEEEHKALDKSEDKDIKNIIMWIRER
ncbi:MAG: c-type cytochrome [Rhodocyclales bacterium]|nr:c-type cytochrome [Rhodocyclales bacterium]